MLKTLYERIGRFAYPANTCYSYCIFMLLYII